MRIQTFITGIDSRKVLRLVCIGWFITKLLCLKLWLAGRLFPLVPVHESLQLLPSWVHAVLLAASLGLMLLVLIIPSKKVVAVLLILEILSCLLDQNRWQPWEYQFLFFIAAFLFQHDDKKLFVSWQLILAAIYFFSGLSKLNSDFIHDVWQHLMLSRWLGITHPGTWLLRAGYLVPVIEMAVGIGLLFAFSRKISAGILCTMHILILLLLGPAGLNINAVVWPWNIMMILLLITLFLKKQQDGWMSGLSHPFSWFICLCWWILPWLQLAGYWDKYLSAVLYGGGVQQLYICTDHPAAKKEMAAYFETGIRVIPCSPSISVYHWGMKEMNTAPYPEKRIYNAIIREWKKRYPGTGDRFYLFKPGYTHHVQEWKSP